jgi:hypothetical protein
MNNTRWQRQHIGAIDAAS